MADKKDLTTEIELPAEVTATVSDGHVSLTGPKGEVKRDFADKQVAIENKEGKLVVSASKTNKNNKKQLKTKVSHIKNMIKGATEGHQYKLKICSGHFPMNVAIKNNELEVKNFLGEKVPRTLKLKEGADVKLEGEFITVEAASKELAGQVSADIENLTKRTNYDTRIFQDGIYIVTKDGKDLA